MDDSRASAHSPEETRGLKGSHGYGWVLALIIVQFVYAAAIPSERWTASVLLVLESVTLLVALRTSGLERLRRAALALVGVAVVAAVVELLTPDATFRGIIWLLDVALLLGVMVVVGSGLKDQREVTRQTIHGAVSIYLGLGMLFSFAYGAIAAIGADPFFEQGTDGTPAIRLYFSYVTLATLGYGDYTAAGDLGRTLSVIEAMLGQLYLVTVIALIVALFARTRRAGGD
jgi:hypothetical protein